MPEAVTSPSEKLVPIVTSGNSVDVTLKEDKEKGIEEVTKEDAPIVEVQEEVKESSSQEVPKEKEEELEEYSAGVKRRIDKLTRKMREAERREQAAVDYAKNVNDKYKQALATGAQKDDISLKQRGETLVAQEEFAKRALQAAIQAQDVEKQVEAQQEIGRLAIEKERLKISTAKREYAKNQQTEGEELPEALQETAPSPTPAPPDPRAKEWASRNKWFGQDKMMTYAAMGIHEELVDEGFDATTEEYYKEVDVRIRQNFPQKFEDKARPTQKVASAIRTSPSGRRTVRLTPSQVAIAKKLGVPLEEYAKHVKEA